MKDYCLNCDEELNADNRYSTFCDKEHPIIDLLCNKCGTKIVSNYRSVTIRAMTRGSRKRVKSGSCIMYKETRCSKPKHITVGG